MPIFAQKKSSWTDWKTLYSDNKIKVEIKFKIRNNSCLQGGKSSKYKYKITGTPHSAKKYVFWKIKYVDCNNSTVEKQNKVLIGGSNAEIGTIESMDYIFMSKKVIKKFYDVDTKIKQDKNYHFNRDLYKKLKKQVRQTIPFKYNFTFGGGIYTDLGSTDQMNFKNLRHRFYDPYISFGLFRKTRIKPKFTYMKHKDISRATLIGIFADAGLCEIGTSGMWKGGYNLKTSGFVRLEAGVHFRELFRVSAGIFDFGIDKDFSNHLYSLTLGLTVKIRKIHIDFNYFQTANQSFTAFNSYFQTGVNFYLNFFRTVPRHIKYKLKNGLYSM